jgi:hypothetical protein
VSEPRVSIPVMSYICTVEFADGWSIRLRALFCQATYAGHLEGPITARQNDGVLRRMKGKANELFGPKPVHLVEPERITGRLIDGDEFESRPVRRESLPPLCCIGDFEGDVIPGQDGCASGLIVMWFQSEPPPVPIEPQIVNLLFHIPWVDLAISYCY